MKLFFPWIICLLMAGVFLYAESKRKHIQGVCFKGLASLSFVVLGFLGAELSQDRVLAERAAAGLCLGAAADVVLNLRYIFTGHRQQFFLAGTLVFLAGHVMYITALVPKCSCVPVCVAAAFCLAALLIWQIYQMITADTVFRVTGFFYLGAIMLMTCLACGILFTDPSAFSGSFASGAVLFLASDIILILNAFGPESTESGRISNIVLYYVGQLLIASSLYFV